MLLPMIFVVARLDETTITATDVSDLAIFVKCSRPSEGKCEAGPAGGLIGRENCVWDAKKLPCKLSLASHAVVSRVARANTETS